LQDAAGRLGDESPTARAVIQLFSGSINDTELEAVVQSSKSQGGHCSAYFDAMWYAEIMKDDAAAQRYLGDWKISLRHRTRICKQVQTVSGSRSMLANGWAAKID
jgi:hypothetical protein